MQRLRLTAAIFFLLFGSSCAAMFTGTKSSITFTSTPSQAEVTIGDDVYTTPVTVKVPKKLTECTIKAEGYEPRTVSLGRTFQSGFLVMDILLTPGYGLVGILIDGGTGAWYRHPESIQVDFHNNFASTDEATPIVASATEN